MTSWDCGLLPHVGTTFNDHKQLYVVNSNLLQTQEEDMIQSNEYWHLNYAT